MIAKRRRKAKEIEATPRSLLILGAHFPPEPSGNAPYTGGLSAALAGRGWDVRVFTTHPSYPRWEIYPGYGQWRTTELHHGVTVTRFRHFVPRRPNLARRLISEVSFGARLWGANWGHPDAILSVSPALFSTLIARLKASVLHPRKPFVVWVQDIYSLGLIETGQGGSLLARLMLRVEGWLLRSASAVVVVHPRFAERLHRSFGVPQDRIHAIRNWTHVKDMSPCDPGTARTRMGWRHDETVVVHAGNMGVKQGLDNVVLTARLAAERSERIRFVLLGGGGEEERLRLLSRGVDSIDFVSSLPDQEFVDALHAADILLVNEKPGVAEMAVPSKLTSYFDAGKPVVAATDPLGITATEIAAADAGLSVAAGDPEALLTALLTLAADRGRMQTFGSNGARYRAQVLGEDFAVAQFDRVLRSLDTQIPTP